MAHIARHILATLLLIVVATAATAQSSLNKSERETIASALQKITLKEVAGSYVKVDEVRIRNRKI